LKNGNLPARKSRCLVQKCILLPKVCNKPVRLILSFLRRRFFYYDLKLGNNYEACQGSLQSRGITQNRPTMELETLTLTKGLVASISMSNVLSREKKQQAIALAKLGWPLRRIEQATGIRRETAGDHPHIVLAFQFAENLIDDKYLPCARAPFVRSQIEGNTSGG
jgi:hypothetical protein